MAQSCHYRRGRDAAIDCQYLVHIVLAEIGDIDVSAAVHCYAGWIGEVAQGPYGRRGRNAAIHSNNLVYRMEAAIGYIDVSAVVYRHARGKVEAAAQRGLCPAEVGGLGRRDAPCAAQQHNQNSAQGNQLARLLWTVGNTKRGNGENRRADRPGYGNHESIPPGGG